MYEDVEILDEIEVVDGENDYDELDYLDLIDETDIQQILLVILDDDDELELEVLDVMLLCERALDILVDEIDELENVVV